VQSGIVGRSPRPVALPAPARDLASSGPLRPSHDLPRMPQARLVQRDIPPPLTRPPSRPTARPVAVLRRLRRPTTRLQAAPSGGASRGSLDRPVESTAGDGCAGQPHMVGMPGFEPGTSCSQSRRAAKLRHIPYRATNASWVIRAPGSRPRAERRGARRRAGGRRPSFCVRPRGPACTRSTRHRRYELAEPDRSGASMPSRREAQNASPPVQIFITGGRRWAAADPAPSWLRSARPPAPATPRARP
jgi:hypothetical protein